MNKNINNFFNLKMNIPVLIGLVALASCIEIKIPLKEETDLFKIQRTQTPYKLEDDSIKMCHMDTYESTSNEVITKVLFYDYHVFNNHDIPIPDFRRIVQHIRTEFKETLVILSNNPDRSLEGVFVVSNGILYDATKLQVFALVVLHGSNEEHVEAVWTTLRKILPLPKINDDEINIDRESLFPRGNMELGDEKVRYHVEKIMDLMEFGRIEEVGPEHVVVEVEPTTMDEEDVDMEER